MSSCRTHLSKWLAPVAAIAVIVLISACGGSSTDSEPTFTFAGDRPSPRHDGPVIDVYASENVFNTDEIKADANEELSIIFVNNDAAPHNVAIYTNEDAEEEIYVGETFTGPGEVREYTFTAPGKGTYFFRCDVHPTVMTGEFKVG
jgi:plastocyanin